MMISRTTYIVDGQEEGTVGQNRPDEDIGEDAENQGILLGNHDGSVPVDGNKGPRKRPRYDWGMDESRISVVPKIHGAEIDKIDEQEYLSPSKTRANKEHHESRVKEVVDDEVASNAGGSMGSICVAGEEMGNVAELKNKEGDPI